MGLVQDSLLGSYLLSQTKNLTLQEMMRLICSVSAFSEHLPTPATTGSDPRWTSQQLLSLFLPQISYKKGDINIAGGQMASGTLDGDTIAKKNNSLFHVTWNDYGPIATRDLFNSLSWSANAWLQIKGFSCGINDCVIGDKEKQEIHAEILKAKATASVAIQNAKMGSIGKENAFTYKKEFPRKIIETMNSCRGVVEKKVVSSTKADNSIDIMVKCGSKGTRVNMCQIVGMLGQQEIEGSWVENQSYRRTLPHYHKDDLRPEAHGFIENSFMTGLSPTEYWAHAQEGRIGIITKAIKTAETGYLQRKFVKALEDLRICYDGTVRNANNMIIQTVYGHDGFDASYLETQDMFFVNYNMEKLCQRFKFSETDNLKSRMTEDAYQQMMLVPESERRAALDGEFDQIVTYYQYLKTDVPSVHYQPDARSPINFKRLILNMISKFELTSATVADIDPVYIVDQVRQLRTKLVVDPRENVNTVSTIILNSLMATYMSSKVLICEHKFNRPAFDHLIQTIYITFLKVLVNPGENVGIIAAQSMGEPTTQMALNTFHHTGQGSKANITRGTPRLRELMSLSKNPKTPSMTVYIQDDYYLQTVEDGTTDKLINTINCDRTSKIGADIEYTMLRDLLTNTEIFYDETDRATCIHEDQEFVDSYYEMLPDLDANNKDKIVEFKWLLRMEFDREAIMMKHIPMYLIEKCLNEELRSRQIDHTVIVSDDNAQKLICRIKVNYSGGVEDPVNFLRDIEAKLLILKIKGVERIEKCLVNTVKKAIVLPNGSVLSPFGTDQAAYDEAVKHYNNFTYMLDTDGSNLLEIMSMPNIDTFKTVSNDVWEIYQLYGIEAARKCIISEINRLFEDNGYYVNRHVILLVDVMTNQGSLVSVDRHGVNKTESGPLHRASFEETTTQLTTASIFSEVDMMTGVSGNIMFGQFIPTGTNSFRMALDLERIKKQTPAKQDVAKPQFKTAAETTVDLTDFCADDNFDFTFKLNPMAGAV
jgi:DNA-directed RNA polymerase II subunit RPB1